MKSSIFLFASLVIIFSGKLFAQINIQFLSQKTYANELSNIWGYVDDLGNEYALVGEAGGLSIVNIADPINPVEVHYEPDVYSTWRELKHWKKHAFVVTEGGGGMMIVDMTNLPVSASLVSHYTGVNFEFSSAHTISVDENGIGYIFGADYGVGGAIILDLNNPTNPIELGVLDEYYIHDGFVRGDTLWASCVYDGLQVVYDMTNKANPIKIAEWATPDNFTHNSWLSDNGNYLFTTDEVSDAVVASYDVSDLGNVVELDRYQSNPGSGSIPHNTYFLNNYLITSYYRDGVTIVDAARPHNLIEVGNYDTSPLSGDGFNADWGVYPYLPSGNLILSDIENGLFVLGPTYQRACYLEGLITDSACSAPINDVKIRIIGTNAEERSTLNGMYATGYVSAGTYSIEFSKPGYLTRIISGISLSNGVLTTLNVRMLSASGNVDLTGSIQEAIGNAGIANAEVFIQNASNTYSFTTDVNGAFELCNFIAGSYTVQVSKWGYENICIENQLINGSSFALTQLLQSKYQDNFNLNLGWTVQSTASSGKWTRAIPIYTDHFGMPVNPGWDDSLDCGNYAYITGNGGGNTWTDDVDNGTTSLISPSMDLSGYVHPFLKYSYWYATVEGFPVSPFNDRLRISISNGIDTVLVKQYSDTNTMSRWVPQLINLEGLIDFTLPLQLLIEAEDIDPGHVLECGFDRMSIFDSTIVGIEEKSVLATNIFPNPSNSGAFISFKQMPKNATQLQIYDIQGLLIDQKVITSKNIPLNQRLNAGTYFIHVYDENNHSVAVFKWIVL